ncbi:tRNA(Ile2) 2-agmatinylcytidine synthetase [Methanolobus vulcani]|jgi:tRNA(Ile2)-agmatinylcytidine synthase|uniref:tRNA(Ile2) 2-agmatinylcytidine synthetase TiaS n=1 Tax=Methanolobus vulcani TaxID=38026 RepID=A0A7Z7AYY6_9EURY|nr:tRNA(Ile)(2)-agmatinylcytidine synthase [Methanolobus vulcani]MDK2825206.1 tRNA(Ile2)-agmatinylcytidine synthase [Methanolobus sp.]MDK2948055.1 tRNA(Ile2)-agmatinylcytidine synthase [Methanolobus sp.]SDG32519.1 tRNA(Ile2) 2-agmatinylcytidine synthetase [Methanolobus vulcani]
MSSEITKMVIGIDDTDSREGMCTTYLCALLRDELSSFTKLISDPILVRLNPTIPYKTRGNASVALFIECGDRERVIGHVKEKIASMACLDNENTNPGVVFVDEEKFNAVRDKLRSFFKRAVKDVITIDEAKELVSELDLEFQAFKNGRGLIGALSACGAMLDPEWDHTYEYLAYRKKDVWGTKRSVDESSLFNADRQTYPDTWDTVDLVNNIVVCVPHSGDPVLYGIRGKDVSSVEKAASFVVSEPVERFCIYRTNQGTDMHLISVSSISEIEEMRSYILEGEVCSEPVTIRGGHTIFILKDTAGDIIDCAAFEPTKNFRELIRKLISGDKVLVYGSVTENTINIEKIKITDLSPAYEIRNPQCPSCGKRMKSAGSGQGYRCKKCGTNSEIPERTEIKRDIVPGFYEVPPCARRHLAKLLLRFENEDLPVFPGR